jgi:RNA polymerase sigma factor (sigma-70 family)
MEPNALPEARRGWMSSAVEEEATLEPEAGADVGLVGRARAGDRTSYETLYRRHRDRVARTAYLLVRDRDLAQDVAQEAFLIGWRDLGRLRDTHLFRAWVTGIAVNLSRRRSGGVRVLPGRAVVSLDGAPEQVSDPGPDREVGLSVRAAVASLPRRLREAIVLRFYGGLTESEMSAALSIPAGTVKSRLARARARLVEELREVVEEER